MDLVIHFTRLHGCRMFPMDRLAPQLPVTVEYTAKGQRVRKVLPNSFKARAFFAQKLKAGAEPKVVAPAK